MKIFDQILGHENIIERLLYAYQNQKLGSVYLFIGPSGVGKKKVALGLAQALVCEQNQRGCGICPSCLRVAQRQSESLILIEPEGPQIKVEQAHEVLKFLSLKPMGKSAVVVIDQAHLMNQQSANMLLKALEEPAQDVYFILLTSSYSALLPTIRSRGQVVRFGPLSEDQIRKNSPQSPLWAIRAARGSFERLTELSHIEDQELRQKAAQILLDLVEDEDFLMNEN
ncbi:MAG TPA: AAA family ATPase, partial [Pseudobdellovibrionaceae bacterium]|nr:AAA family ATPase [Pseudobdellovibrionaceae bacterium]